jgi:hypothetical protein
MRKNLNLLLLIILGFWQAVYSQVAINTTGANPDASAGLDVSFTNKGVLIPRVALTQTTSSSPITSPATSLMVYNTATVNDVTPGYYYWDGSRWVRIAGNGTCNTANYVLKSNGTDATCSQIFDNGTNVGIGTTNPTKKLEVYGTILASNGSVSSTNNTWANHDSRVAAITEHPAFVGLRARGTLASPVYPSTNDVLLTVTGRDMIDGYNGYGGNLNAFGGGSIEFRAEENFSGTNKGTYIAFNTTNIGSNIQTEKMRITANGNVGIGTNAPNAKLDIKGIGNNNSSYGLGVRNSSDNYSFVVRDDGNVGIGTPTPSSKLEIAGGNNAGFLRLNNGTTNPFVIYFGNNLGGVSNSDGVVYFEIAGTETYVMGGHVVPDDNLTRDLGSSNRKWGNVYANDMYLNSISNWISNWYWSDKRFKKDIEPINSALSNVLKLKPVKYSWKTEEFPDKHFDNKRHIGLIAQEVEEVYPELVNTNNEGFKSVDYNKLTVVLIKAIQELNNKIEQLEKENKELKKKLNLTE